MLYEKKANRVIDQIEENERERDIDREDGLHKDASK